jgi:hypothetical protein
MDLSRRSLRFIVFLVVAAAGAVVALEFSVLPRGDHTPAGRPTQTASLTSSPSQQSSSLAVSIPPELSEDVWFDMSGSAPIARRLRGTSTPLPLGITPLDANSGRALIASADPSNPSVYVLDLASGDVLAQWDAPFQTVHGQLRGERIYIDDTTDGKDVGVWTATFADDALSEFIAPPATPPDGVVARGPLRASWSGMTAGSSLCGMTE